VGRADDARRQRVRRELLPTRDGVGDLEEEQAVPLERFVHHRAAAAREGDDRAGDGGARLVDERAERGVAAVEMAELVRQHRLELRHREHLHERQTEAHHAAAEEPHEAAALRHEGVHVADQVDLDGHRLASALGHLSDGREELRVVLRREHRPGRLEAIRARNDRPEDRPRGHEADQDELDADATEERDLRVHEREEPDHDGERQRIEPREEKDREEGSACE
jgi:hypothetical protein